MTNQQSTVKVPTEHQLVIPQYMLEEAGIAPGDQIHVSCVGGCISLTRLSAIEGSTEHAKSNGNGTAHITTQRY
jgi:bifunctional DNA-binding transcriptional regulator/antitoxin component of YhaV-PrlF toxin-antitoxin module